MSRTYKLILIVAGGLAGLMVLVVAVVAYVLGQDAKSHLVAVASQALEMEVTVDGGFSVGLFPRLHVAMTDVHASRQGVEIASADALRIGIALLPLLRREVRISTIGLRQLKVAIVRDRDGMLNISHTPRAEAGHPALSVANVSVTDATLHYSNEQSGEEFEATECNLEASRMSLASSPDPGLLKNLSLAAKLACSRVQTRESEATDLRISINGSNGVFELDPITMVLFGGQGAGRLGADFSGPVPAYQLEYRLTKFRLDEFPEAPVSHACRARGCG